MPEIDMDVLKAFITEQLNPISSQLTNLDENMAKNTATLQTLKTQSDTVNHLHTQFTAQATELSSIKKQFSQLQEQLISMESYSRRSNLQILNVPEKQGENCETTVLNICDRIGLEFNARTIERAHRLGRYQADRVRPIIVRFHHYKDRQVVWAMRGEINTQSHARVIEDFPPVIAARRRKLSPICEAAYKYRDADNAEFRFRARLSGDKLIVDGKTYTVDTLDTLPEPLQPKNVFTPSDDHAVCFFTAASPLSNHYLADMTVGQYKFNCMEQFLMHAKAIKFGDTDIASKVLQEPNPAVQKSLGRKVAAFNMEQWAKELHAILMQGLEAKFHQSEFCKDFLMATGNKQIGEATKDTLYGIGMNLRHPNLMDIGRWKQQGNMMGKCLMEVRLKVAP